MSLVLYGLLAFVSLVSSIIATFFGVAGGSILFLTLTFLFSSKVAIPIHGVVQFLNNGIRSSVFRKHISWNTVFFYGILSLPGALLGGELYDVFSNDILEVSIAITIIITNHLPGIRFSKRDKLSIISLGFLSSFLGMIVGVTGPILTSFFTAKGFEKENLIGTKSMCQVITQLSKSIVFFKLLNVDFELYSVSISIIMAFSIIGILFTKRVLHQIEASRHKKYVKMILDAVAFVMIINVLISNM